MWCRIKGCGKQSSRIMRLVICYDLVITAESEEEAVRCMEKRDGN